MNAPETKLYLIFFSVTIKQIEFLTEVFVRIGSLAILLFSCLTVTASMVRVLPDDVWDIILKNVPYNNSFKQWAFSLYKMRMSKAHIKLVAEEWFEITQKKLSEIPDDGSNDINIQQREYLRNALHFHLGWHEENKKLLAHSLEELLIDKIKQNSFETLQNYFVKGQDFGFGGAGRRIARVPLHYPVDAHQRMLFILAFNHTNCDTLASINATFMLEQVNGMGKVNTGFVPFFSWHKYFDEEYNRKKFEYQKINDTAVNSPFTSPSLKPLYTGNIEELKQERRKKRKCFEFVDHIIGAALHPNQMLQVLDNAQIVSMPEN